MGGYHTIYLTGAPATGKSTLSEFLTKTIHPLRLFCYSKELLKQVNQRGATGLTNQDDLRRESAAAITWDDVGAVDQKLIELVQRERGNTHLIIDSHAVTKERYGYRVTPFSLDMLRRLAPSAIVVLYADAETTIGRIQSNAQGRPIVSEFDADFHMQLQANVALMYAIELGLPIHFLDSNRPVSLLADEVVKILGLGVSPESVAH